MNYQEFLESVKHNKIHAGFDLPHMESPEEPLYAFKTSGSVKEKVYVHSLSNIKNSCQSFLSEFQLDFEDKWGVCLSTSHVAGFSILARTYFGNLKPPCFFNWSASDLIKEIDENKITILSCVPTQIFDLVKENIKAPSTVKHVFVGGAPLPQKLLSSAKGLGWPIVLCYGSTETFAQMSYSLDGLFFKPFKGWSVSKNTKNELLIKGPGLFIGTVEGAVYSCLDAEFFNTEDLCEITNLGFKVLGKSTGLFKIKGSYFDFNDFKQRFAEELSSCAYSPRDVFPAVLEEDRNGAGVYLVCNKDIDLSPLFNKFPEIRGVYFINQIKHTSLQKIRAIDLSNALKAKVLSL
jgi:O-succinylbenzoic acid--CoA ligase